MEEILHILDELGIIYEYEVHPPIYTIDQMYEAHLAHPDDVVKNLFVRDDKKKHYYLLVVENNKTINLKELRTKLHSRPLSFASEADLMRYLRLGKGEVTPLGLIHDETLKVAVIFDEDLQKHSLLGVHPNVNTAMVYLSCADLEKLLSTYKHPVTYIKIH